MIEWEVWDSAPECSRSREPHGLRRTEGKRTQRPKIHFKLLVINYKIVASELATKPEPLPLALTSGWPRQNFLNFLSTLISRALTGELVSLATEQKTKKHQA